MNKYVNGRKKRYCDELLWLVLVCLKKERMGGKGFRKGKIRDKKQKKKEKKKKIKLGNEEYDKTYFMVVIFLFFKSIIVIREL
ncbi:MAG: hypothetical protein U5J96_14945 [Ignavibacteriaceae bacterium]|nr:hypothetical protein [Ignavibacteriaceae bacterium]